MRSTFTKSITALILVFAMAVGMTASLGGKAKAATPINIAYAAGDDAKINGGPVYNVNAYVGVATTITTVKPTRSGCNFLGWTTTKNSGRIDYKSGQSVTFTKATTLWPVWNANIAYAAGDGKFNNGSPVMNVSVTLGKSTKVPTSVPVRSGFICLGWSTTRNSSTVQYKPGETITYTKPVTLWPVWDTLCCTFLYYDGYEKNQDDNGLHEGNLRNYLSDKFSKINRKLSLSCSKVNDGRSFREAWKNMPSDQSVVMISCHGDPFNLCPGMVSVYDIEHDVLTYKNIKVIILLGCNCGHVEHYYYNHATGERYRREKNIAWAFAEKFKCVVYASDGNVHHFTLESGRGAGDIALWAYYNSPNTLRKHNYGWIVYDGSSGKTVTMTGLGLKEGSTTTIGGLLDAYYAQRYSW